MQRLTERIVQSNLPDIVTDQDIHILLDRASPATRFGLVKRALASQELIRIRRGLYAVGAPYRRGPLDLFHVASRVLSPSYISLESALSAHGWIPEYVHTTTSCAFKRSRIFDTAFGRFEYRRSPLHTLSSVEHRADAKEGTTQPYLIASPLRALADLAHDRPQQTMDVDYLVDSLRIDEQALASVTSKESALLLSEGPRGAARRFLENLREELGH